MGESTSPAAALGRVRGRSGQVVGTAFLVTADLVLTCAHVVSAALGGDPYDSVSPAEAVTVEFPLTGDGASMAAYRAVVVGWRPARVDGSGDTALLRLDRSPPAAARPARLTLMDMAWGDSARVFGFPADLKDEYGVWVEAKLRARQGAGWLQIESPPQQRGIGPGFSGSPVWNPSVGRVIGMVVAAERGNTTAYLIPVRTLVEAHPEIAVPDAAETCPYRGLDPFLEEHSTYFRGRESLTERCVAQVARFPLVALAGPSGSGKSSLVHAGLTPRLRRQGMLVATFRPLPGARSTSLLANAVIGVLDPDRGEVARHDEAEALADRLDASPARTVPWLAGQMVERAGDGGLLIFGDQFEELATQDAHRLWLLLHDLTRAAPRRADGTPRLHVVLTMRSGALDTLITEETALAAALGIVLVPAMSRSQLQAAVSAADVDFEPGLVNRIIEDTGSEPGQLPLLEFTLTQLWQQRSAGTLTHRAYEDLGGVSGALARYAEEVYDRLPEPARPSARRLLIQLARPEKDGSFLRRPVRLTDLGDYLRPVLGRLVASRLVVVSKATDGSEVADLAHQELIRHWPQLREWLTQERDFRSWQEGLRTSLAGWDADGRDTSGLLRGAALTTADRWAREHPEDIGPAERAFIRASRANERRRVRILRSVVAAISVLAVAATALAVIAARQTAQAEARLRTAVSRSLADEADRLRDSDPRASLQLAQAAWHHDQSAEAWGALFTWYAALQSVDKVYQDAWEGDLKQILTSPDGSVVVFVSKSGLPAVWTGMTGEAPERWRLPTAGAAQVGGSFALSPSGRYLGYISALGGILLWDLARRTGPVELAPDTSREDLTTNSRFDSISFSPDDSRVLVWSRAGASAESTIRVWEVRDGRPVRAVSPKLSVESTFSVSFGHRPDTLLLTGSGPARLYQLDSGRLLGSLSVPDSAVTRPAGDGALITYCDDERLHLIDVATFALLRTTAVPSCTGAFVLRDGPPYAVSATSHASGDSNTAVSVTDLRTGRSYQFTTPPIDFDPLFNPAIALYRGSGDRLVAITGVGTQGYQLAARPLPAATEPTGPTPTQPPGARPLGSVTLSSPDDRWVVAVNGETGQLDLLDRKTGGTVDSTHGSPAPSATTVTFRGLWCGFSRDSKRFLVVQGDELVSYSIPGLAVERRMSLPVQPELGKPPDEPDISSWASSVAVDDDGRIIVLHAGVLTRWDVSTGDLADSPLPLRADHAGQQRSALLAVMAPLPRPGHRGEVAVVEPNGDVEIWSINQRRPIATVAADAVSAQGSLVFDLSGSRLAIKAENGLIKIWNIDERQVEGAPIPVGYTDNVLGFTPEGRLLTVFTLVKPSVQLWDDKSGKSLATLTMPIDNLAALVHGPPDTSWSLTGNRLTAWGGGRTHSWPLDPDKWMESLCALNDRPYTEAERQAIERHDGASEPPCG